MIAIEAEMGASVWKLTVEEGATVESGTIVAILESMKMEIPVEAPVAGVVRFKVAAGSEVAEGQDIAVIEPA